MVILSACKLRFQFYIPKMVLHPSDGHIHQCSREPWLCGVYCDDNPQDRYNDPMIDSDSYEQQQVMKQLQSLKNDVDRICNVKIDKQIPRDFVHQMNSRNPNSQLNKESNTMTYTDPIVTRDSAVQTTFENRERNHKVSEYIYAPDRFLKLILEVVNLRNLGKGHFLSKKRCFIKIRIGEWHCQTRTLILKQNVVFHEKFLLHPEEGDHIEFEVWKHNGSSEDQLLARSSLQLNLKLKDRKIEEELPFRDLEGKRVLNRRGDIAKLRVILSSTESCNRAHRDESASLSA